MLGTRANGMLICQQIAPKLADEILQECLNATDGKGLFQFRQYKTRGHYRPRREAYLREGNISFPYSYSGNLMHSQPVPRAISEFIATYCLRTNEASLNGGVLVNEYPGSAKSNLLYNRDSGVGKHSDNSHTVYLTNTIYSLTVGASRIFRYRRLGQDTKWNEIMTTHGMLISMKPGFQVVYEHDVPKPLRKHQALYAQESKHRRFVPQNDDMYRYNLTVRPQCIPCEQARRSACPRVRKKRSLEVDNNKETKAPAELPGVTYPKKHILRMIETEGGDDDEVYNF